MNLNSVTYITSPAPKVAIIIHYTGQNEEGITLVGRHFEPITNTVAKQDFLDIPSGDRPVYPHATLDSSSIFRTYKADSTLEKQGYIRLIHTGTAITAGSIATAFLKSWI
eukprot:4277563-Heterocapsa_arctica.AAC.1